jgi:hypothetical protein
MSSSWIYDIETLRNCTIFCFVNKDDATNKQSFVLHPTLQNDYQSMLDFIRYKVKALIGFNNLNFDCHILDACLKGEQSPKHLYYFAQDRVESVGKSYYKPLIRQIDLFRIKHFDNKAKLTSLKDLEFHLRRKNVMDMPIHHGEEITTMEQINTVLEYCFEDCDATLQFYNVCHSDIQLRIKLSTRYAFDFLNMSDSSIGENVFGIRMSKEMGISYWDLKKLGTDRECVAVKDILLDYYSFKRKEFVDVYQTFANSIFYPGEEFNNTLEYDGLTYTFGKGGLHAALKGLHVSDDLGDIESCDVASYYPNLSIVNDYYPEHLGHFFVKIYSELYNERKLYPKGSSDNIAIKLALNSVFGKSNDQYSWIRDLKYFYFITINGQLSLLQLAEWILDIPGAKILCVNTDGIEAYIPKQHHQRYKDICVKWQSMTKLNLEFNRYTSFYLRDVNNYLAIDTSNHVKLKGAYEIYKDYHKDDSFRIVPIAVYNYIVHKIPISDTITHISDTVTINEKVYTKSIYDYMGRMKVNTDYEAYHTYIKDKVVCTDQLSKTTRYAVVKNKTTGIYKQSKEEGKKIGLQVTYNTYPYNLIQSEEIDNYNLNYHFYIKQANALINPFEEEQQLSLL